MARNTTHPSTGEMNVDYDVRRAAENRTATIDEIIWNPAATSLSNTAVSDDLFLSSYYGDFENGASSKTIKNVVVNEMLALSPTIPLRTDSEKKALLNAIRGLSPAVLVDDVRRLIDPKIVASNITSQFRLLIFDEDMGRVEIRRSGRGWGREVTVAAVVFRDETDFTHFLQQDSFSEMKKFLVESVLKQTEIFFATEPLSSARSYSSRENVNGFHNMIVKYM